MDQVDDAWDPFEVVQNKETVTFLEAHFIQAHRSFLLVDDHNRIIKIFQHSDTSSEEETRMVTIIPYLRAT